VIEPPAPRGPADPPSRPPTASVAGTACRAHRTVEGELSERDNVGRTRREFPVGSEHGERDRQVVGGSDFREVCRRQIYHDPLRREGVRRGGDGCSDAFFGFANCGIREPDDHKSGIAATDVHFNTHGMRLNADDGA
jgi:hypothetical protein